MTKIQAPPSAAALKKKQEQTALGPDNLLGLFETSIGPLMLVLSLWGLAIALDSEAFAPYLILSLIVFALAYPGKAHLQSSVVRLSIDIALNWLKIAALLLAIGLATGYAREFSPVALGVWLWLAPLSELIASLVLRSTAQVLIRLQGPKKRAVVVGMNEQGLALASRLSEAVYSNVEFVGFVDSRKSPRRPSDTPHTSLASLDQLADLVQTQQIQVIYLSLPMASQPRILQILDELKDTTASIYFVPDMFITDLIQSHSGSVNGMPVISVCETPFKGTDGLVKRLSDIVFSVLILILICPVLLAIAMAVKLGSTGPIIFKQRRYGLDGKEFLVYKFRSMNVTEDGGAIGQAQRNDPRVTGLGAFLRRSSLDELPQFINVLQGRMSIVGPRPHAVAHNELYRKLIKGYMVRHKVKPGITGWAQVNGYRGETETLDKMQGRIDFDLDYLRNWSLRLDVHIILKTILLVLKDQKAY